MSAVHAVAEQAYLQRPQVVEPLARLLARKQPGLHVGKQLGQHL